MILSQTRIKLEEALHAMDNTEIGPMLSTENGMSKFARAHEHIEEALKLIESMVN
jgi:hypothetical protein